MKYEPIPDTISLHGLGFIQVKLGGNQRLHVWHPDLPRRRCIEHSAIHNHRFTFDSRVLVGTIINRVYDAHTAAVYDKGAYVRYMHDSERGPNGGRGWRAEGVVSVNLTMSEVRHAGSSYALRSYVYHDTLTPDGYAATIMRKLDEGTNAASTLCLVGTTPDDAFDRRQLSHAQLWQYVKEVLGGEIPRPA